MSDPECCFICDETLSSDTQTKVLKQRGIKTLIAKSKAKKDDHWKYLERATEIEVHEACRIDYCSTTEVNNGERAEEEKPEEPKPDLKSRTESDGAFDFKKSCFLCMKRVWSGKKYPSRTVGSQQLQDSIEVALIERGTEDEWALSVEKLIHSKSLPDVGARYHMACYSKFLWIPENPVPEKPKAPTVDPSLAKLWKYMEDNCDSQFLMEDLVKRMGKNGLTMLGFRQKLLDKFDDDIIIVEKTGKPTIVCFRDATYKILMGVYKKKMGSKRDGRAQASSDADDSSTDDSDSDEQPMHNKRSRRD